MAPAPGTPLALPAASVTGPPLAAPARPIIDAGPVIDDITVEKPSVCSGEENLITVKAHTTTGTDELLHYVIDGQLHPHISLATDQRAFGGHLEAGTSVFTFAAVTIGVLADGADLKRLDDKTHR